MNGLVATRADFKNHALASSRVYAAWPPPNDLAPSTNFMLIGTSTFMTSTPYRSFVNSVMLAVTISGFFFA